MNEEKTLDEKELEEVTGGALSINELEAMSSFVSEFTSKNCGSCARCGKNCPYTPITMYGTLRGYETCSEHS